MKTESGVVMKEYILRMVGDVLLHEQVYQAAFDGDKYQFDGIFEHVGPWIREADLAVINQETILVSDRRCISAFPLFGSPTDIGEAISGAGFHIVLQASNHSLDKAVSGIGDTLRFWREEHPEVTMLGLHSSREDAERIPIRKVGDLRIALLNCAEKMNYHPMPIGKPYIVDRMRKCDRKRLGRRIARARESADLVVVFPHWGCEYLYEPVEAQKKWARFFAESGADLIIGTHPHVVQYQETIVTKDGRQVPCLYSLGNFVSCQVMQGTALGAMADVRIRCGEDGAIRLSADMIPLVLHTDSDYSFFTVYPLEQYTDELAAENKVFSVMQRRFGGERMDPAHLTALFEDIRSRRATQSAMFKKPSDVTKYNLTAVIATIRGKNGKD